MKTKDKSLKKIITSIVAIIVIAISCMVIKSFAAYDFYLVRYPDGRILVNSWGASYCLNWSHACRTASPWRGADPLIHVGTVRFYRTYVDVDGRHYQYNRQSAYMAWLAMQGDDSSTYSAPDPNFWDNCHMNSISQIQFAIWRYADAFLRTTLYGVGTNAPFLPVDGYGLSPSGLYHEAPISDAQIGGANISEINRWADAIMADTANTSINKADGFTVDTKFNMNGKAYVKMGPFTMSYSGDPLDLGTYARNGEKLTSTFYKYVGNQLSITGFTDPELKAGGAFYILLPKSDDTNRRLLRLGIQNVKLISKGGNPLPENDAQGTPPTIYWFRNVQPDASVHHQDHEVNIAGYWQPTDKVAETEINVDVKESIIIRKYGLVEKENGEFVVDLSLGMLKGAKFRIFNETTRQYVQLPREYLIARTNGQNPEDGTHGYDPNTGTYTITEVDYQPESSKDTDVVMFETKKGLPIILENLKDGKYTVEEVKAPIGYEISNNPGAAGGVGRIEIPLPDGSDGEMHFHNKKKPGININKYGLKDSGEVDTEKGILEGARFIIRKIDGENIQYIKHDDGYNWLDNDSSYEVKDEDYIDESEIDPQDLKRDSHFTFTNIGGQSLQIFDLKEGTYEVEEIVPPEGYDLSINGDGDGNIATINIPEQLKQSFDFHNPKETQATLLIKKVDENGLGLTGAGFTIQKESGEFQGQYFNSSGKFQTRPYTFETPKSGEIYIQDIMEGTYIVRETYAPEGYILPDPKEWTITVKKHKENVVGPIVNEKEIIKKLTFRKIDKDSGVGLEGFKFAIHEKSVTNEYKDVYPELFDPSNSIYKDATGGNVDYWSGVSECQINPCTRTDSYYVSHTYPVTTTHTNPDGSTYDVTHWYPDEWTCTLHGKKFYDTGSAGAHCRTWNDKRDRCNQILEDKVNKYHRKREEAIKKISPITTDENGYADLSALRVSGDDKHGLFYMVETSVGSNPYYDVDSSAFDIDYLTETDYIERENKRKRLDIEGCVWEDKGASGKDYASNTVGIGLREKREKLVAPVEVALYYGENKTNNKAVVSSSGTYRLRVNVSDFENNRDNIRVVFTYNGLKYESVFVSDNNETISKSILNADNGTKALEPVQTRDKFNKQIAQINSNKGYNDSVVRGTRENDGKQIEYKASKDGHSSTVNYEGSITSNDGYKCNADQAASTGDAKYKLEKMPGQKQIDPDTKKQEAPNPYDDGMSNNCYYIKEKDPETPSTTAVLEKTKYQIQADTGTAGYSIFNQFSDIVKKQGKDTIKNVNLGLYVREQPDIAIKNDIFAVMVQSNGQNKWYKYGENMNDIEEKEKKDKVLGLSFGNNKKIGTYTREVSPSEIEAADSTNFEIKVVYETKIRNESSTLSMMPNEIVSFYDTKYDTLDIKNVSDEPWNASKHPDIQVEWKDTSQVKNGTHLQSDRRYKAKYGTISAGGKIPIERQTSVSIYTQYTIKREAAFKVYENDEGSVLFYNQVEVNSYSTSDPYLHKRTKISKDFYAGIDSDSAAGSAKIEPEDENDFKSWEDDTDDAPDFKLQKAKNRKIKGTVFKDKIVTSGAYGGEYKANGINDGDEPLSGVRVELVELNDDGTEKLWDHNVPETENNPYKPYDKDDVLQRSGTRQQNTTMVELDEDLDNPSPTVQALKYTGNDGKYEFSGFIPGRYVIKYTWGGKSSIVPVNVANTDEYIYPEQYKSTNFVDESRYDKYTKGGSNPDRWLLIKEGELYDYRSKSNAIDDMKERSDLDKKMHIVDGTDGSITDPADPRYTGNIHGNYIDVDKKGTIMHSRTPAFEVGIEALYKDKDGGNADKEEVNLGDREQGTKQILLDTDRIDFGICERPKMGISLEKEIERVKIVLANGQTLVDAEVNGGNMLRGVIIGTTIMPSIPANPTISSKGEIGTLKVEMDTEIMQGATLEITYKYTIINTSSKDYVIKDTDTGNPYLFNSKKDENRYYKFAFAREDLGDTQVEIEPTVIVDYLSNGMNYLREYNGKGDKNAPEENTYWERVTGNEQKTRIQNHFFDFRDSILYDKYNSRYEDYARDGKTSASNEIIKDTEKRMDVINKYYWTIVRDQEGNASADKIRLKAGEQKERKFVASKVLTSTNEDMEFYNSAEIIKITKTGGGQPEEQIPGDELPLEEINEENSIYKPDLQPATESDGSTAEYTVITGPTGDIYHNYERGVMIAVALAGLSILGIGTAIIRRIVFTIEDRRHKKIK